MEEEQKKFIMGLILGVSLLLNVFLIADHYDKVCFNNKEPIYISSNITLHIDRDNEVWRNMRCSLYLYKVESDNIVCDEAWNAP